MSEEEKPQLKSTFMGTSILDKILVGLSIAGLVGSVYLLFVYKPSLTSDNPIVANIAPEGSLRRRHAKSLAWEDIDEPGPIYLRDIVYTPKGSRAVATLNEGRKIELGPDSLVQFDEVTLDGVQITLLDFSFRMIPIKPKQLTLLPDPRPLELLHSEATDRLRAHFAKPIGIRPVAKLSPYAFAFKLPDFKILTRFPPNETFNISANRWLEMRWSPVPLDNVKFQLQISLNSNFVDSMLFRPTKNGTVVQFDAPGDYYWRVVAVRGKESISSERGEFSLKKGQGKSSQVVIRRMISNGAKEKEFIPPEFQTGKSKN